MVIYRNYITQISDPNKHQNVPNCITYCITTKTFAYLMPFENVAFHAL